MRQAERLQDHHRGPQQQAGEVATAEALQASLKKVGINAEIDQYDGAQTAGITGSPNVVRRRATASSSWAGAPTSRPARASAAAVDSRFILQNGNYNFAEINDPTINKLFDDAIARDRPARPPRSTSRSTTRSWRALYYLPFVYDKALN